MNNELRLVKEGNFYKDEDSNIYMTRKQIGEALEYSDGGRGIRVIHSRNKDRLDKFSTTVEISQLEGNRMVTRDTIVYTERGIAEVVRYSSAHMLLKEKVLRLIGLEDHSVDSILFMSSTTKWKQDDLQTILEGTFVGCSIETEVSIGQYRVDFLLGESIIVECDENNHKDRDREYEKHREDFLKGLGYKVLRYNPDSGSEECLGVLIHEINMALEEKFMMSENPKLSADYGDMGLLIRTRAATRLFGGYIFDVDAFCDFYFSDSLTEDELDEAKKVAQVEKARIDKELGAMGL